MGLLRRAVGEIHWTQPPWLVRMGSFHAQLYFLAALAAIAVGFAVKHTIDSWPRPPGVAAVVTAPGVSPVVDGEIRPQPLLIRFSVVHDETDPAPEVGGVARLDQIGAVVESGIRLDPEHPGEWRWRDENEIEFMPASDWPAGERYTVRWTPELFTDAVAVREHSARFETPSFAAALDSFVFYQDPSDSSVRKGVATLTFSHPVDAAALARQLTLSMRPSGATLTTPAAAIASDIRLEPHGRTAYVHSATLTIPDEENFLALTLARGLAPRDGPARLAEPLTDSIVVPDIESYFRIADASALVVRDENDAPGQVVTLSFTDRVAMQPLAERIGLYLLPATVTRNGRSEQARWQSPREVTADVLAAAERIDVTLNPVDGDAAMLHSLALDLPEGRDVYVRVSAGLVSAGDFALARDWDTVLRIPRYPRETRIAQSGALLPLTGDHKLTFLSRGVTALKVDIGRVIDGQVNHLASQTGGDIQSPYFQNYRFDADNLAERSTRYVDLNPGHPRDATYASLDLSEFLPSGGFYFITVQGWDRARNRPVGGEDRRFVLITDLGLIVKTSVDGSYDAFVHSIDSGQPVAGARVELLGKNGIAVMTAVTGNDGHAALPSARGLSRERAPTVFVVRRGRDSVFLPVARRGRMLQLSRFDVGGEFVSRRGDADQLRAQLFSERGLYRPGEAVHLAAIVKRKDWIPVGELPLILTVRDARGQVALEQRLALPEDGLIDAGFDTEPASPTGNYTATLYLIDERERRRALGSATFRVEEFQPDRLRIRARIDGQKSTGWQQPGALSATVTLENLFGTPADARRVTGALTLTPITLSFPAFPGYVFDDPLRDPAAPLRPVRLPLSETQTDTAGRATFALDLAAYDDGIYRLTLASEGFEAGDGRSVRATAATVLSPLPTLVGYKVPGELSWLDRNTEHVVALIALDSDAEPVALDNLTLDLVAERYVSTLVSQPNGTLAYQSVRREEVVDSRPFAIAQDGTNLALDTAEPGRFAARLRDADGRIVSQVRYVVAGPGNLAGDLTRDAELDLALDAGSYAAGDEIRLQITAPYAGTGLITIERDRVYAHRWFETSTSASVQRIRVPDDLEGNAYVSVAFVRGIDSPEVFVSPLSYAVAPFAIDRDARSVDLDLDVPETVRPGERLAVGLRADRPVRALVYAVDEGILQVANYRMPDPLGFFLRKMALQVSTHQMVDLILPAFDPFNRRAAPGGGEGRGLAGSNLNPFRRKAEPPVVYWSGIVDAGPGRRQLTFDVPDYFNGELRVMAVAVTASALGRDEARTTVRGPFVITPSVLTAVAPGDSFDVTVGLANNLEGSGPDASITLTATPSAGLEIDGDNAVELAVAEGREGRARFRLRARDRLGPASLMFEAASGTTEIRRTATLSVRPPVASITTVAAGSATSDSIPLRLERRLYANGAEQRVAASASPLVLADGLLEYLETYPHYCVEQLVSRVFPQIGLLGSADTALDDAAIRGAFDNLLPRLRARQSTDGWFRYWLSSTEPVDFVTVYTLHFLTDARELGLPVPPDMLRAGLDHLGRVAVGDVANLPAARIRAYAIYVLTRNGQVTTNSLTQLHETLERLALPDWQADITAAYMAASYALLRQIELATPLIRGYAPGAGAERTSDFDTRLGRDAQYVYLLARHFPAEAARLDGDLIATLAEPVMQNRFTTVSSAYTVLALGAMEKALGGPDALPQLTVSAADIVAGPAGFARGLVSVETPELVVAGGGGSTVYHLLTQTGFDREPPQDRLAAGLELDRQFLNADGKPVTTAAVGDELTVQLRIRATGELQTNVAVVDLLPGGFEVLSGSLQHDSSAGYVDYQDVREDRVVTYGTFDTRAKTLRYRVKLTSSGSFHVPSVFAGAMYNPDVQARTAPGRFEVQAVR